MKKLLLLLFAFSVPLLGAAHSDENYQENDMLKNMQPGDKAAELMVHFGTSYDDTRAATIDAINAKITLVPFMFVAGDHAQNDIACEWRDSLEKAGYKVDVVMEGLGEVPQIQDIYISHIKFSLHHRAIGIMEKKAKYASEK